MNRQITVIGHLDYNITKVCHLVVDLTDEEKRGVQKLLKKISSECFLDDITSIELDERDGGKPNE